MSGIYGGSPEDRHFEKQLIKHLDDDRDEDEDEESDDVDGQIQDIEDRDADYEFLAWREP